MNEIAKCQMSSCAYNMNGLCRALAITVRPHAECNTYNHGSSKGGFREAKGGIGACLASDCKFNDQLECVAPRVDMASHDRHADCETFQPRAQLSLFLNRGGPVWPLDGDLAFYLMPLHGLEQFSMAVQRLKSSLLLRDTYDQFSLSTGEAGKMNGWLSVLKEDPTNWLLEKDNPSRYFILTALLGMPQKRPGQMANGAYVQRTLLGQHREQRQAQQVDYPECSQGIRGSLRTEQGPNALQHVT